MPLGHFGEDGRSYFLISDSSRGSGIPCVTHITRIEANRMIGGYQPRDYERRIHDVYDLMHDHSDIIHNTAMPVFLAPDGFIVYGERADAESLARALIRARVAAENKPEATHPCEICKAFMKAVGLSVIRGGDTDEEDDESSDEEDDEDTDSGSSGNGGRLFRRAPARSYDPARAPLARKLYGR